MKRKFTYLAIAAIVLGASAAVPTTSAEELLLYSDRHYEEDEALFKEFTKETGIEVKMVKSGADQLIERLKAEGAKSPADLLLTADAGRLHRATEDGLLQAVESEVLAERIPENLRHPEGYWFGFTQRSRVIVYAKDRVKPSELSTYEDLADPKWRGRILARSSSNIYNQSLLASIIAADGADKAEAWAAAVRKNMARAPQGSDRDQAKAVVKGLGDIAIMNTYYVGLLASSPDAGEREVAAKIGVFFPNQDGRGAHVNVSGAGVTKVSKNKGAAVKLLEFLTEKETQEAFAKTTYEYPAVKDAAWSDLLKSWGEFKADDLNLAILGKNNKEAVRIFNRVGWE
ncbi:MAG: Fe(3+) ABC transporter substrate-binding protein [Verrucomicrobiales bacterium]